MKIISKILKFIAMFFMALLLVEAVGGGFTSTIEEKEYFKGKVETTFSSEAIEISEPGKLNVHFEVDEFFEEFEEKEDNEENNKLIFAKLYIPKNEKYEYLGISYSIPSKDAKTGIPPPVGKNSVLTSNSLQKIYSYLYPHKILPNMDVRAFESDKG